MTATVTDQAGHEAALNQRAQRLPVGFTAIGAVLLELLARQAPEHAPATAICAVRPEQRLKVSPSAVIQREKGNILNLYG